MAGDRPSGSWCVRGRESGRAKKKADVSVCALSEVYGSTCPYPLLIMCSTRVTGTALDNACAR